jgi:PadR family transcriptional regulator, regulatory protein PadR
MHPTAEELSDLLDGASLDDVRTHIESCVECKALVSELTAVRRVVADLPPMPAPDSHRAIVMNMMREEMTMWSEDVGAGTLPAAAETLDLLLLKTLSWGPRDGIAASDWLRTTAGDSLIIPESAVYLALHRLEARGLVTSAWVHIEGNERVKQYELSAAGRQELAHAAERLSESTAVVFRILHAAR